MANVNLKTDFKDGEKLFGQQLNNNFAVIKAALEAMNKIVWQDDPDDSVLAFRGTTEEINQRDVIDGQLLYDTSTGETYIDVGSQRISTGSGNAIHIGSDTPTNPATQLWVDPNEPLQLIGTEVTNSMEGTESNKAPSVQAVKNYMNIDNVYSTDEIKTNKIWEDGKPIYRKVIYSTKRNIEAEINSLNIETPTYFYGLATSKYNFIWEANTFYPDEVGYSNWYHWSTTTPRVISWQFQNFYLDDNEVKVVLEYTKVDDTSGGDN